MGLGREGRAVFSPSCMQMDGGGWRSWWIIDVVREAAAKKEVRFKNNKKASCRKNICFIVKTKNQIENPLWIFIQPKVTWKFTVRCFFKLGDHFGPWRSPAVSPSMRWFHWVHWLRMHHPTLLNIYLFCWSCRSFLQRFSVYCLSSSWLKCADFKKIRGGDCSSGAALLLLLCLSDRSFMLVVFHICSF